MPPEGSDIHKELKAIVSKVTAFVDPLKDLR